MFESLYIKVVYPNIDFYKINYANHDLLKTKFIQFLSNTHFNRRRKTTIDVKRGTWVVWG